VRSL
jgi:hypothetical protein